MRKYEEKHFNIDGVPFIIRKVGVIRSMGSYVLFENGRFKCRGTHKLCRAWAMHFAKVARERQDEI